MPSHYPRPEMLAETGWLAEHLDDPSVRIVDCDDPAAYWRLHIPGAVGLQAHHYLKDPRDPVHVMPPDVFAAAMSAHGIGDDTLVVAYDGSGGKYAARLWWTLEYYGHTRCKLLNGGFHKWLREGRPVTRDVPSIGPARFQVRSGPDCLCTVDDVRDAVGRDDTAVWDVRSLAEHSGDDPRENRRAGHIPGAAHLEWLELTDAPPEWSGHLLPADEIRQRLEAAGITPDKQVYAH